MSINSLRSALGVSRDLTFDFKNQRKNSKLKKGRFSFGRDSGTNAQSLLPTADQSIDHSRAVLPPRWVDAYESISEDLNVLQKHSDD
jgi:hypothetical protein